MTDETQNGENKPKMRLVKDKVSKGGKNAPKSDIEALGAIADADASPLMPYYEVIQRGERAGVWFYGVATDKDGAAYMKAPVKLSDPMEIIGRGQGHDEKEYRVLRYKRLRDKEHKVTAMPLEMVGGRDGWAYLRSLGIGVVQSAVNMAHLANYLQWEGSKDEWAVSKRGGWADDSHTAYILPTGEIIGAAADSKVVYIGDTSKRGAYQPSCGLQEWQESVARYAPGNSRLLLALGAVFASPLLGILKAENGGFHFFGSSSIGKSISGLVALSVVGDPEQLKVQWNGTGLSFDNTAAANNDGAVFLDEIGQADGKTLDYVAYSVFNGAKKGQGAKDGGNREHLTWRVMAISTGEYEPAYFMKKYGMEWQAGQAVRLPAIPADAEKGMGTFEELHGFKHPDLLAGHLEQAAKTCYGAAWRAYLAAIAAEMKDNPAALRGRLNALRNEFAALLPPDLQGQAERTAKRFVLAAAALALACEWGITGFDKQAAFAGVLTCFNAWLEREGGVNREERVLLENARSFFQVHGKGERFFNPESRGGQVLAGNFTTDRHHAGYSFPADCEHGKPRFYVVDSVFQDEICKGQDMRFAVRVFDKAGWLMRGDARNCKAKLPANFARSNNLPPNQRYYCFSGDAPPSEWEDS